VRTLKQLSKDRSGNFGMMTALLLVPIIGIAGGAIDVANIMDARTKLIVAADSTALSTIGKGSGAYTAAASMLRDGPVDFDQGAAGKAFWMNAHDIALEARDRVSVEVQKSGDNLLSTVEFAVDVPTYFLHLFGYEHFTLSAQVTAVLGIADPTYTDFHILLDNSPSMGLGATNNDINLLLSATTAAGKRTCAFACHEVWNSGVEVPDSNFKIARQKNIKLRIDLLRESVLDVVNHAATLTSDRDRIRFAAYTFGRRALASGHQIDKISDLTSDLLAFRHSVSRVSLMTTQHSNFASDALTSFENSFEQVAKEIEDTSSDADDARREQVVLLVTDGVGNSLRPSRCTGFYSGGNGRCIEPVDVKTCTELKERGIKIAVLYTTYFPIDDHLYNTYVKKFSDRIGPKLAECASPGLYAEVGIQQNMSEALKMLFTKSATELRLRLTS
jgi:hypothetical protein